MTPLVHTKHVATQDVERLTSDVAVLSFQWHCWLRLFQTDDVTGRQRLYLNYAPIFCSLFQHLLRDSIFLRLTKLVDKRSESLTFQSVLQILDQPTGDVRLQPCRDQIADYRTKIESTKITKYRHERIAHRNRDVAIGLEELPPVLISHVTDAIQLAQEIVHSMREFLGMPLYVFSSEETRAAEEFLHLLAMASAWSDSCKQIYRSSPEEIVKAIREIGHKGKAIP